MSFDRGGGGELRFRNRRGFAVAGHAAALREELKQIQRTDASAVRRADHATGSDKPG